MLSQNSIRVYIYPPTYIYKPLAKKDCSAPNPSCKSPWWKSHDASPLFQCLLTNCCVMNSNPLLSALHKKDKEMRLFPPSTEASSAETTPVQLIQSFYRAGYIWSHLYSPGRKQIMFFTTTMSVSVTVSTSKRKTRPVLTMALFHSSEFPVQRLSPNKTLGETKGRACFTPGWAQPPLLQRQESTRAPAAPSSSLNNGHRDWKREFNEGRRVQRIQTSKERQEHLVCYSCWRKKCFLTPQKNQNISRWCWGIFFFFFLQTWNKEKNHKPTQPKNHAFFSHWTGAKAEGGRKWGGYAKHQNVQWSKWEIFKPKQQLSAQILTLPKKLFRAEKHTEQERGILTNMTWTSSVFSPAGDFQASRMWRKIKKPPQLQRNVRIRWSACYLLVFGYCERWRNNPENHLQQEIIPDSSVQSTWW